MKNILLDNIFSLEGKTIKRIVWEDNAKPLAIITSDDCVFILDGEPDPNSEFFSNGCIEVYDDYDVKHLDKKTQYKFGIISHSEYIKYLKEEEQKRKLAEEKEKQKKEQKKKEQEKNELKQLEYLAKKYNKKIE
jgi:hypothetical protein